LKKKKKAINILKFRALIDRVSLLVSFSQTGRSEPCDKMMRLQELFLTKRSVKTVPVCNRHEQTVCDLYVQEDLGGGIWNYLSLSAAFFTVLCTPLTSLFAFRGYKSVEEVNTP
jgi:hypothetical protein